MRETSQKVLVTINTLKFTDAHKALNCCGIKLSYIGCYFIFHCQLASDKAKKRKVIAVKIGIHPSYFAPQSFLQILTFFLLILPRLRVVTR